MCGRSGSQDSIASSSTDVLARSGPIDQQSTAWPSRFAHEARQLGNALVVFDDQDGRHVNIPLRGG